MHASLALLVLLTAAVAFWFDAAGARERARGVCKRACRGLGVQLLDDTVALKRLRPGRNARGRVCLVRDFRFEYSPDGAKRERGLLRLRGRRPELFYLQRGDYREYLSEDQVGSL